MILGKCHGLRKATLCAKSGFDWLSSFESATSENRPLQMRVYIAHTCTTLPCASSSQIYTQADVLCLTNNVEYV
jgi:hypothetical protein